MSIYHEMTQIRGFMYDLEKLTSDIQFKINKIKELINNNNRQYQDEIIRIKYSIFDSLNLLKDDVYTFQQKIYNIKKRVLELTETLKYEHKITSPDILSKCIIHRNYDFEKLYSNINEIVKNIIDIIKQNNEDHKFNYEHNKDINKQLLNTNIVILHNSIHQKVNEISMELSRDIFLILTTVENIIEVEDKSKE